MANHKSAIKRIKSDATKNMQNKYVHKTTRNAIKEDAIKLSDDEERSFFLSSVFSFTKSI